MIETMAATKAELNSEVALLRAEAGFVADPDRRDVTYWYQKGLSKFFLLHEVMKYAKVHRWVEKRVAFWRGVQSAWLKQRHLTLINELQDEFREAKELRDHILRLVKPKMTPDGVEVFTVQPKSLEGMIRAFAAVDDVVDRKRKEILDYMQPMMGIVEHSTDDDAKKSPFSPDEMRKIAHQLLEKRRHEKRVELNIQDDDYTGDDDDDTEERKPILDIREGDPA